VAARLEGQPEVQASLGRSSLADEPPAVFDNSHRIYGIPRIHRDLLEDGGAIKSVWHA